MHYIPPARAPHMRPAPRIRVNLLQPCIAAVRSCFCGAQPTKLKEYESNEKLASRARSEQLATSELLPTSFSAGPRMSATVMSHFDRLSLLASDAARFATGFMSSAVSSSCAQADQP